MKSPIPQDTSKPKLTEKQLETISGNIHKLVYTHLPGKAGEIISYSENSEPNATESGVIGDYKYTVTNNHSESDWPNYFTDLKIEKAGKEIFSKTYEGFSPIGIYDIKTKSQNTKLLQLFTYGAHCCVSLVPITLKNNNLSVGEPLDEGNVDIIKKEYFFVQDDNLFKIVYDDRFSYYDLSFAESTMMFFPLIYQLDEKGFTQAPQLFKDYYQKLYEGTKQELSTIDKYFIDWENDDHYNFLFAKQIYQYTLGYFAGINREVLKSNLTSPWPNIIFNEEEIFKYISTPSK